MPRFRILLVEDNPDTCVLLRNLLAITGHSCQVCPSGTQALEALDLFKPTAVILDVGLPDLSGLDVARMIRARPDGAKFVLVGCSGYGTAEDRQRAIDAGMDDYFVKPALLTDILAAIEQVVTQRNGSPA